MSTSVKHFYSGLVGLSNLPAPTTGNYQSFIDIIDQCLVNGFGQQTATSVVVSGEVATVTVPTGPHPFQQDIVVLVAGATPAGLNGEKRITLATTTTCQFAAPGVPDGTATGTITVKVAPAGWEKVYSGTAKGAYRSGNPASSRRFLRLDPALYNGSSVHSVAARGYASMSDVDTGTGEFPTVAQVATSSWARGVTNGTRSWVIVADDKTVYLQVGNTVNGTHDLQSLGVFIAGDFFSYKAGDAFNFLIHATSAGSVINAGAGTNYAFFRNSVAGTADGTYTPRQFNGLGASTLLGRVCESYRTATGFSGSTASTCGAVNPLPINSGLLLSRIALYEPGQGLRGVMRGVYDIAQNVGSSYPTLTKIDGQGDLLGRKLMAVACADSSTPGSAVLFDITGPWI